MMYEEGERKIIPEALKWYRLAAIQGDEYSQKAIQRLSPPTAPKSSQMYSAPPIKLNGPNIKIGL